jgi:hypothetical protein
MSETELCTNKVTVKQALFEAKRKEIFDKIMDIIGLEPDNNKSLIRKDDLELKYDEINKLMQDVYLYYPSSITGTITKTKNKEISCIRQVLEYNKHSLKYKFTSKNTGDKQIMPVYYIIKNM